MNLNTTIDLDLKGFFQWWGRELAFLLPEKLRQALRDRNGVLAFSADESGFSVGFEADDETRPNIEKRFDFADLDAYRQWKNQHPEFDKAETMLRLTSAQALRKIVYLPAAAQENLQQVVGFELDRYTPFKPEQVYSSAVTVDKTELGQLRVMLILTPRLVLDRLLTQLADWGVRPDRVEFGEADADIAAIRHAYNLLPERYRQQGSRLGQVVTWSLNLLLLCLMLAVLVWPVWLEGQAVDSLKARIKALEKQTRVVEAQQLEIDALHAETQKLIDVKQQSPALLAVLNELSSVLNDETWLTHLQYSDKHLQIQGQSPAASALIGVLEASDYFSNVSFVSPLTQDKVTGRERFQISMDVTMPAPPAETPEASAPDADAAEPSSTAEEAAHD